MEKVYRKIYNGKEEYHIFTKSGIKQSLRYDKKNFYSRDAALGVKVYGLLPLEEFSADDFLQKPKERFFYIELKDTDYKVVVCAETVTEASEKFIVYLEQQYPELSYTLDEVLVKELDVVT